MADAMRSITGRMLVSINDQPEIRRIFAGLPMRELNISYAVGGSSGRTTAVELLIG